jgi:phage N-6-adenine-methyltransferase
MIKHSQGTLAQDSGKAGDSLVAAHLIKSGITIYESYSAFQNSIIPKDKIVAVKQYPYTNWFGAPGRIDFGLFKGTVPLLGIEVKTQEVPGSVDEKMLGVLVHANKSIFPEYLCATMGKHWKEKRGKLIIEAINLEASLIKKNKFVALDYEGTCAKIDQVINNQMKKVTKKVNIAYVGSSPVAYTKDRDSDSWYTPEKYTNSARNVFGGTIDLDPFSSVKANETVKASRIFTEKDDGCSKDWNAKSVWLNPPYGPLMKVAVNKFLTELEKSNFEQAIILCNNSTDTGWFKKLADTANALCFTDHRISFIAVDGKKSSVNTRGQCFLYYGNDIDAFYREFSEYGLIVTGYKLAKT